MARILNIFATVPGVEDIELIHRQRISESFGTGFIDMQILEDTTAAMSCLLGALDHWRQDYVLHIGRSCWETRSQMRLTRESEGPLFDSILWYDSLEAATIWTLYTTISLAAYEQSYILQNPAFSLNASSPYLSAQYFAECHFEDHLPSIVPLAHAFMRSVEYHLRPIHIDSGAFYILWPARLAYTALRKERRECKWLKRVMEKIADEWGLALAKNILGDDLSENIRREERNRRTAHAYERYAQM